MKPIGFKLTSRPYLDQQKAADALTAQRKLAGFVFGFVTPTDEREYVVETFYGHSPQKVSRTVGITYSRPGTNPVSKVCL